MTQPSSPPHYYHGAKITRTMQRNSEGRRLYRIETKDFSITPEHTTTRREAQAFVDATLKDMQG